MREHQIVITLKPEQFLEVQRLSRAANAKSMGIFVRQKLLAALGIEGSLGAEQPAGSNANLTALSSDLKRLHGELKLIVAESLSVYIQEPSSPPSPEQYADSEPLSEGSAESLNDVESVGALQHLSGIAETETEQPLSIDIAIRIEEETPPEADSLTEDMLEQAAEKAFAISPRLGAIGDDNDDEGRQSGGGVKATSAVEQDEPAAVSSSEEELSIVETSEKAELHTAPETKISNEDSDRESESVSGSAGVKNNLLRTRYELHSRREMHHHHYTAGADVLDVPFQAPAEDSSITKRDVKPNSVSSDSSIRSGSEASSQAAEVSGVIATISAPNSDFDHVQEPSIPVRDPLDKLLGDDLPASGVRQMSVSVYDEDEDDDMFDIPLSIAERRKQLAEQHSEGAEPESNEMSAEASEGLIAEVSEDVSSEVPPIESAPVAEVDEKIGEPAPANQVPQPTSDVKPGPGRPLGYPPLSGNPPPKRRQV